MCDPTPVVVGGGGAAAICAPRSPAFAIENPFSFKVGQVFTGFGVGCGVGLGVGRPIYLGSVPALQQALSATRGATEVFSGVGRFANASLQKFGAKNIQAGVGCGFGIGHGFGVGLALKPGVAHRFQSFVGQALAKAVSNIGILHRIPPIQNLIPGNHHGNLQTSIGSMLQLTNKNVASTNENLERDGNLQQNPSRAEKVFRNLLQNPLMKKEEMQLNDLATNIEVEKNMLQMLLQHQLQIEELLEDNQVLRKVLAQDLGVPEDKLNGGSTETPLDRRNPCESCFECRRRKRSSSR